MRAEEKDSQVKITKLFNVLKSQIDPLSPMYTKIAHLTDSCLKENRSYYDFKKRLYTVENGFEQQMLEIIKKFEYNTIGGIPPLDVTDYVLHSKNTVTRNNSR